MTNTVADGASPTTTFAGTTRFEVRAVLGRGAHGVVYRAFDRETNREVALKTVSEPDAERALLLRTEFRALARITHPNLVELYDLVSLGSTMSFFTMEFIEGENLASKIQASPRGVGLGRETIDALATGLISALDALHAEGRLHRDVKPSNVMIRRSRSPQQVVLVDFGLSMELRQLGRPNNTFAGTLLYMAPEQAWGRPTTEAADHYSTAAVLWEALTGTPPFEGRGAQLLFEKERPPTPPKTLSDADLPLAEVLARMMDPNPESRPGPRAILEAIASTHRTQPPMSGIGIRGAAIRTNDSKTSLHPNPFVGRASELRDLSAALADVQSGRAAFASVEGPSGIGKTELLTRFVNAAEKSAQAVVLRGRCHPRASVPYAGFDGIIDDLSEWLSTLPEDEAARLMPEDARALVTVFPILGSRTKTPPEDAIDDAYAQRQRAVRALRELFTKIATDSGRTEDPRPADGSRLLVLWIDDAQWGSADAGQLLADIFRHPTPPVLLVLSYRSEDRATSSLLRTVEEKAELLRDSAYRLTLAPMAERESQELALLYLRDDSSAATTSAAIARDAGGHPMFLRELAFAAATRTRAAVDEGAVVSSPPDLRSLLTERINRLGATEKELLALAATAGRPLPRRILLASTPGGEQSRPEVFRLAHERLLRETWAGNEPAVEPYHGYVRDAVMDAMADDARKARHLTIAAVLLKEPEPDADALVDHFVGAGDFVRAGKYAEIAGKRAEEALAFDRATHLYRLAIEHGAGTGSATQSRHELRSRLGWVLANAGRSSESADAYAAAAREALAAGKPSEAHRLERIAAEHALRGGDFEVGVHRLRSVLAAAGVPYPSSALSAFATFVHQRARLAMRGLDFDPSAQGAAPPDPKILSQADACWTAGLGLTWIDRTRVAAYQARYMRLALESGDPGRVGLALSTEASQLACLGGSKRTSRARSILARAKAMTDRLPDPVAHAFVRLMDASIAFYASQWRTVIALCASAEEILHRAKIRSEWERLTSQTLSLAALAYAGELATLRVRQAELIAEANERGNRLAFACLASGPANVGFLLAGDPDLARRRADEALSPWKDESFQLAHYFHLVARCQIDLYEGHPERTLERLEQEWRRVQLSMSLQIQNFRVTLRHLRARAAIGTALHAPSKKKRERLLDSAREEAKRIREDDVAWAKPLALSLDGGIAAAGGDGKRAANDLREASVAFREIDMLGHAAAVDLERGRLLGGDEGRELVDSAEQWLKGEKVVAPDRISKMLVPGVTG